MGCHSGTPQDRSVHELCDGLVYVHWHRGHGCRQQRLQAFSVTDQCTDSSQFVGANFLLGMANLNNPSYVIQRWHCVLVTYLMAIVAALFNIFAATLLNKVSTAVLVWNIGSFLVVVITILATNDNKQPASFVFTEFQNETGFSSPGMAVMIGLRKFSNQILPPFSFTLVCHSTAILIPPTSPEFFRHVLLRCAVKNGRRNAQPIARCSPCHPILRLCKLA